MVRRNLPTENQFVGDLINGWKLEKEIGRGNVGVVYRATKTITSGAQDKTAIKIIPSENLKEKWDTELEKVVKLAGIPQVVQYRGHQAQILQSVPYVCIFWEYVDGLNLRDYIEKNPSNITLAFIDNLVDQILQVFLAMKETEITHGDLHKGNIMIADPDPRRYEQLPMIKVGDFGIGGSHNNLKPKDDYVQFTKICHFLLDQFIDPAKLDNTEVRYFYKYLVDDFLPKKIFESNPTVGEYVRNPRVLLEVLHSEKHNIKRKTWEKPTLNLKHPFDYLNCEQIGDSFELLQKLYSNNFPGYRDLLQKANTVLTGPRGCGKTTIFRNLSLKTHLHAKKSLEDLADYVGIYYHCGDLYFPFHYLKNKISDADRQILVHYFNLALLKEILDTLLVSKSDLNGDWKPENLTKLEHFLKQWLPSYTSPPQGTDILRHLLSFIEQEKHNIGLWLRQGRHDSPTEIHLPPDFIPNLCQLLQQLVPWLKGKPFYFLLDDYSLPHISKQIQATLHDLIMYRWSSCFFKVSTESIITFHPYDSSGKLVEETREYDVIDLGAYFIQKQTGSSKRNVNTSMDRKNFIVEVINNRLNITEGFHPDYKDIRKILGPNPYKSYNELARQIRKETKIKRVHYAGLETIADLFSGDIADILRLVRGIFSSFGSYDVFSKPGLEIPIPHKDQDRAIREYGASFLNRIEAAPNTGAKLRSIAEAFGKSANWVLKNRNSKNVKQNPPWQAFRLEVRERFSFDNNDDLKRVYENLVPDGKRSSYSLNKFIEELKSLYEDLLKYGLFLRDVRGKSQRGAVVPRLYLRRLLIPTFLLTPNQRDSIGLEVQEFLTLLYAPERFNEIVKRKKPEGLIAQGRLF